METPKAEIIKLNLDCQGTHYPQSEIDELVRRATKQRKESVYCAYSYCGVGPFCDDCNDKHCDKHNQEYDNANYG